MTSTSQVRKYMNPYAAGVILGLALLLAFFFAGRGLGASGAVKSVVVEARNTVAPTSTEASAYYGKYVANGKKPLDNWLVFEVLGLIVGAFVSGAIARRLTLRVDKIPSITVNRRLLFALAGGFVVGIGSQLARGCTSGAALSGMANFSLAGFIAMVAIFGTAGAFAYFFRKNWLA